MKHILIAIALFTSVSTFAQKKKVVIAENTALKAELAELKAKLTTLDTEINAYKVSTSTAVAKDDQAEFLYSVGVLVGAQIGDKGFGDINHSIFNSGFYAGYTKTQEGPVESYSNVVRSFDQKSQALEAEKQKKVGVEFLAENAKKEGVITLPSGLQYKVNQAGTGISPTAQDQVTVHYTGKTLDGKVFDSSVERGQPATFGLNQVIKGWTEGVALMKKGAKYTFYIPSELAYGERGGGGSIPPHATLIFDVELIEIVKTEVHDHSDPNHKH